MDKNNKKRKESVYEFDDDFYYVNNSAKRKKNTPKINKIKKSPKDTDIMDDFNNNLFDLSIFQNGDFQTSNLINGLDASKNLQKSQKKDEKYRKKLKKKKFSLLLENNKLSKKVINIRRNILEKSLLIEKNNTRRVKKSSKMLIDLVELDDEESKIYKTIHTFNTNGKKTIVYFIDSFYPVIDGVVSVMDNYATLLKDEYNIVVCAPKHNGVATPFDRYFVLYSNSIYVKKQGYDLAFPQLDSDFQQYLSLLKIDLIHVQSPFNLGIFGVNLAKRRKIPCFASFHSQLKRNYYNAVKNEIIATWLTKITMNVYKQADVVLTMNDFSRSLIAEYGLKRQVKILPNATNLIPKTFEKDFENSVLSKHGIDNSAFNIIFIGRFVEVKNVYFILKIIENLRIINKNFKMIFLGYGPEQSKMTKIVKEKNLSNFVTFTGKIDSSDEKAILIKNSNLLLFPSDYDTDGIVKIECACYKVPTLCIENTGVSSNMKNDHNAFIEKYSLDAFIDRLDYLIKNPNVVKAVGENAFNELYLTWNDVCTQLSQLYKSHIKSYHLDKQKKSKKYNKKTS